MNLFKLTIHKSQILLLGIFCFLLGIAWANFFSWANFFIFCGLLAVILAIIIGWRNKSWRVVMIFILFFLLGFWRYQIDWPDCHNPKNVCFYNDQKLEFIGIVKKTDRRISENQLTTLILPNKYGLKSHIPPGGIYFKGLILVKAGLYPEYHYGDIIKVTCKLKAPQQYDDFDYEKYLARYNIYSICSYPAIEILDRERGNQFYAGILKIKDKLSTGLNLTVKEPQVSVLQAMILGNRRGLPKNLLDQFANIGISHIIAISGMHIAIIAMILMFLAINLGLMRQQVYYFAVIGLIIYIVMIGWPASAVRAGIMAIVVLSAQKVGRLSRPINAIFLAAFVMLIINPKLLLSDVGWQMSFMAVLGIIYLMPIFQNYFRKLPDIWRLKDMIAVTLSAQIMTLPLIIFYFHKLSLVAILANIVILPIVPFLMMLGMANALVGVFSVDLGRLIGYLSWLGVSYILKMSEWLVKIPWAYIVLPKVNVVLVIVGYGLIWWGICKARK